MAKKRLAVAAREKPDLIFLDYNMPVMDGVTMLRRLRDNAELKRTPVIMLTAESGAENIATVARLGVRDYITKPFDEDLLLAKTARVVSLVPRPTHDRRRKKDGAEIRKRWGRRGRDKQRGPKRRSPKFQRSASHHRQSRCSGPPCWW